MWDGLGRNRNGGETNNRLGVCTFGVIRGKVYVREIREQQMTQAMPAHDLKYVAAVAERLPDMNAMQEQIIADTETEDAA
jgi:hypothetical protein